MAIEIDKNELKKYASLSTSLISALAAAYLFYSNIYHEIHIGRNPQGEQMLYGDNPETLFLFSVLVLLCGISFIGAFAFDDEEVEDLD